MEPKLSWFACIDEPSLYKHAYAEPVKPAMSSPNADFILKPPRQTKVWWFPAGFVPEQPRSGTMLEFNSVTRPGDLMLPSVPPGVTVTETGTTNYYADDEWSAYMPSAEMVKKQHQHLRSKFSDQLWLETVDLLYDWFQIHNAGYIEDDYGVDYETNFAHILFKRMKDTGEELPQWVNSEAFAIKQIIESGSLANYIRENLSGFDPDLMDFDSRYDRELYQRAFDYFRFYTESFPPADRADRFRMYEYSSYVLRHHTDVINDVVEADATATAWRNVIYGFGGRPVTRSAALAAYYMEITGTSDALEFFGRNQITSAPLRS